LPSDVDQKDQAVYDRLSKLSGAAFDRAYARDMVRDHVKDVAAFRLEAKNGTNASIRNFASQTLPALEDHLKDARKMLQSVSPSAAIKSSAGHPGA
jgi:putative membrane protein